jgi:lipopolysaccharide export system permease protein
MASLLNRYLLRETLQTWLVVTLVLLLILMTNQFAAVLGDAAANKLPRGSILMVIGLTTVQYLTILVPVGFFLAVMLSLARLYHDSEMAAMMACGVGPAQVYRPLLALGLVLAIAVAWLALVVAPGAVRQVQSLAEAAKREASLGLLEPGRFVSFGDTRAVIYFESLTPDQRLRNVFVQRRVGDVIEVVLAEEARQQNSSDDGSRVLIFTNGRRYEGRPGDARFRVLEFAEHGIPFALPPPNAASRDPAGRNTLDLLASEDPADRSELHWRLGVPLTLLVLVIVAVPLAKTEPRRGRFSGLASAVLVYVIYANLLAAGRGWLERGQLPAAAGLWWVHGAFLLVAALMLAYQGGVLRWWPRRRPAAIATP